MKSLLIAILLMGSLFKCSRGGESNDDLAGDCAEEAVVKDLTGLDGCGIVLELTDGTRLIPEHRVYVTAPKLEDDPIYYFKLIPEEHVRVSYIVESESMNACMAGKVVFVTCIHKTLEK